MRASADAASVDRSELQSDEYFLHFGYDYYMYVGVSLACPRSRALATAAGLFVEDFVSPYHPERDS
jgi:hypothetical protein